MHIIILNTTNILINKYHGYYKMIEKNDFCFKYICISKNICS
jgi:hypothetical protein